MTEIGASSTGADRGSDGSRSVAVSRQNILLSALDHLEEWLIAILIAAATGLIFVAVVHRYGTGVPALTVTPGSASPVTAAKSRSASGVATSISASTRLCSVLV